MSSLAQFYGIDFGVGPSCTASMPGSVALPEGLEATWYTFSKFLSA